MCCHSSDKKPIFDAAIGNDLIIKINDVMECVKIVSITSENTAVVRTLSGQELTINGQDTIAILL